MPVDQVSGVSESTTGFLYLIDSSCRLQHSKFIFWSSETSPRHDMFQPKRSRKGMAEWKPLPKHSQSFSSMSGDQYRQHSPSSGENKRMCRQPHRYSPKMLFPTFPLGLQRRMQASHDLFRSSQFSFLLLLKKLYRLTWKNHSAQSLLKSSYWQSKIDP